MENLLGQSFGRYHIVERLGEGGMAAVYKAFDTRLERYVALKVILHGYTSSSQFLRRFEREAKSLAQLSHVNIVKVHDYGDYNEMPYLVMEYLPGGTLKQKLGQPLSPDQAARLLLPVARALAYAHRRNIVHRDVKPANILISESNEPMLSDFGIAKLIGPEDTQGLTGTGVGIGTPEYMAPEQGMGGKVDHRADIYALGVVFFEMVTGRTPYKADTPMAVMLKKVSEPLPSPAEFMPGLRPEVEQVLYKALAKDANKRYQHMEEFAAALEKLERMEVPAGSGEAPPAEERKGSRPILIGGAIAVFVLFTLLVLAGVIFGGRMLLSSTGQQTTEQITLSPTETSEISDVTIPAGGVDKEQLPSATQQPEEGTAVAMLPEDIELPVSLGMPLPSQRLPIDEVSVNQMQELARWGKGTFNDVDISPDGTLVAVAAADGVNIYDPSSLQLLQTLTTDRMMYVLAFSPDGNTLVSGSDNRTVYLFQKGENGQWALEQNVGESAYTTMTDISFSADGSLLGLAHGKIVEVWNTDPLSPLYIFEEHEGIVSDIDFSPDGSLLASAGGNDKTIRVWRMADGSRLHLLEVESMLTGLAFSPQGDWLVSSSYDSQLSLWLPESGKLVRSVEIARSNPAMSFDFSPDGTHLAIASQSGQVVVWETDPWQEVAFFEGHAGKVGSVSYSPDGSWVASTSMDDTLRLWQVEGQQSLGEVEYQLGQVKSLEFSPDGETLASAATDDTLRLWKVSEGVMTQFMQDGNQSLDCVTYSPDGELIATATGIKNVYLWNAENGGLMRKLEGQSRAVYSLAFSPDGSMLASGALSGKIVIWNVNDGEILYTFQDHTESVTGLDFSPDGSLLVSASRDKTAILWHMPDGRLLETYNDHTYALTSAVFSPDASMFLVTDSTSIYLWQTGVVNLLGKLDDVDGVPANLDYSADGHMLAVGTSKGTVEIWSIADDDGLLLSTERRLLYKLEGHTDYVRDVGFSPDQTLLASGGEDNTIRLWGVLQE